MYFCLEINVSKCTVLAPRDAWFCPVEEVWRSFHRAPTQGYISFSSRDSVPDIYVTIIYIYMYEVPFSVLQRHIHTIYTYIYMTYCVYIHWRFSIQRSIFPIVWYPNMSYFLLKRKNFQHKIQLAVYACIYILVRSPVMKTCTLCTPLPPSSPLPNPHRLFEYK